MACECGENRSFDECCGRYLEGKAVPSTCEELVRARFVAFGFGRFDYIEETQIGPLSTEVRERQAPEWERLEILSYEDGGADDETGSVEFKAYYRDGDEICIHHEVSYFVREDGEWRYSEGDITEQSVEDSDDRDDNRPCPCGSGRKYRRCCGITLVEPVTDDDHDEHHHHHHHHEHRHHDHHDH